jgi:hypothetical protein
MTAKNSQTNVNPADLYVSGVAYLANMQASDDRKGGAAEMLAMLLCVSPVLIAQDVAELLAASGKTSKRILTAATAAYRAEIAAADWKVEGGTDRDTSWTKSIGHGVKDSKQREIGNVAVIREEKGGPKNEYGVTPRAAGFYVRIWSTRDGKHFGAIPNSTRLDTLDAAKQAADEKLLAARHRAVREAAKGIVRGAK